ncbi:MAG: hypothetical protein ACLQDY_16640 [Streptosporangiaceae bacterium]
MRKYLIAMSAAAGLLMLGATGAQAAVHPHHAIRNATPACGVNCSDVSSLLLGTGTIVNAYISGDTGSVPAHPGQLVNLKLASNSHPNEDFQFEAVGTVSQFCGTLLSPVSVACLDYASNTAYELDWSPFGNDSGYCAGTVGTPGPDMPVRLVDCGRSEGSLLISEGNDYTAANSDVYDSFISGATTQFSHPYVLSVNAGTSRPDNQLQLVRQNTLTGGVAKDSEMFTSVAGPAA